MTERRENREDLRLVGEYSGSGSLETGDGVVDGIRYEIRRFQGFARSGLPVPGVHRLEGSLDVSGLAGVGALVGRDLTLRLEGGQALRVALADASGRVLTEGHGPSRCGCC